MIEVDVARRIHAADGPVRLRVAFKTDGEEIVTLFGPSGCGKTTVLRMIAGLTPPEEGRVCVDGEVWFDSRQGIDWPVWRRSVGFVFQHYRLFPHMTVEENLRFALRSSNDAGMIEELLRITRLTDLRKKKPDCLSGGQRQRVAVVRAFLRRPKVFLFDEPLSALDIPTRLKIQEDLVRLQRRFARPMIFVSHDMSEVFRVSHRILWLNDGRIIKDGSPDRIFADQAMSGKFRFPALVLDIQRDNFLYVVTVQVGQHLSRIIATDQEARGLRPGDRVMVAAKAFNPILFKENSLS